LCLGSNPQDTTEKEEYTGRNAESRQGVLLIQDSSQSTHCDQFCRRLFSLAMN
jgi:hypothetical protein